MVSLKLDTRFRMGQGGNIVIFQRCQFQLDNLRYFIVFADVLKKLKRGFFNKLLHLRIMRFTCRVLLLSHLK